MVLKHFECQSHKLKVFETDNGKYILVNLGCYEAVFVRDCKWSSQTFFSVCVIVVVHAFSQLESIT